VRDLILLSGGMDSTTALALSAAEGTARGALAVDYGQRHRRELAAAEQVAEYFSVPLRVLDLQAWGRLLEGSALTDRNVAVPHGNYEASTMADTVVPNRNATFLMAAVGIAQATALDRVVIAVHGGDHDIYADCRPEFVAAANQTCLIATEGAVSVYAPFASCSKAEVARLASRLQAPIGLTWSCYEGGDLHCGRCGTCNERREAFRDAGVEDPTIYM
jgi:7-cyano-7-deazaguanine synthase